MAEHRGPRDSVELAPSDLPDLAPVRKKEITMLVMAGSATG